MIYHAHITVNSTQVEADQLADLIKGKVTLIDLQKGSESKSDLMLTKYYSGKDISKVKFDLNNDILTLHGEGSEVVRWKLESDIHDENYEKVNSDNCAYIEAHIKCLVGESDLSSLKNTAKSQGWYPSRNPLDKTNDGIIQFVTKRFSHDCSVLDIRRQTFPFVQEITKVCKIIEAKVEMVYFDTDLKHDDWWMNG